MKFSRRLLLCVAMVWAAVGEAAPFAYVPNSGTNDVSVIDTATRSVVATIPTTGLFPYGVAVDVPGRRAYVTNTNSDTVSVIDTSSNTVLTNIAVSRFPGSIAIHPSASRVYVALIGSSAIAEISTTTNTVTRRIVVGLAPSGIALNPAGTILYVANQNANSVSVVDTASGASLAVVPVNTNPLFIAVAPDNRRVLVTSAFSRSVTVIDASSNEVERVVALPQQAVDLVFKQDGTRVYIIGSAGSHDSVVEVLDGTSLARLATIPTDSSPSGIDVTPDGGQLYVTSLVTNRAMIFDTGDHHLIGVVSVGRSPVAHGRFIGGAGGPVPTPVPIAAWMYGALTLLLGLAAVAPLRATRRVNTR